MRILCDYLVIIGFLAKQGANYGLTADSAMFLDHRSPAYLGTAEKFLTSPMLTDGFKDVAAIVRKGEITIIHREYFGFGDSWFGQFGMLLKSLRLTLEGPDPVSPEGQQRIAEKGPATLRGLLNLVGRKLDLVAEYEDRVPAYVEQMFDRLEASGIIVGWDRDDWTITTTRIGLNVRIAPKE